MRVYFVSDKGVEKEKILSVPRGSLILLSHAIGIDIDLVRELDGDDDYLKRMAQFSIDTSSVIVAGIVARIYNRRYLSAVVIDNGKLLGISDATHSEKFDQGASFRMYNTHLGRCGIIVGDDILYPEVMRAFSTHGADYILTLNLGIPPANLEKVLETASFTNGIMNFVMAGNRAVVTNREGEIITNSSDKFCKGDYIISRDTYFVSHLRRDILDNVYTEGIK